MKFERAVPCPGCGHSDEIGAFVVRRQKVWCGIQIDVLELRCPSCGKHLRFRNQRLYVLLLVSLVLVLLPLTIFVPSYLPHFAFALGLIALIVYFIERLGVWKVPVSFDIDEEMSETSH